MLLLVRFRNYDIVSNGKGLSWGGIAIAAASGAIRPVLASRTGFLRVKRVRTTPKMNMSSYVGQAWLQRARDDCGIHMSGAHYLYIADLLALDQCRPTCTMRPLAAPDGDFIACTNMTAVTERST